MPLPARRGRARYDKHLMGRVPWASLLARAAPSVGCHGQASLPMGGPGGGGASVTISPPGPPTRKRASLAGRFRETWYKSADHTARSRRGLCADGSARSHARSGHGLDARGAVTTLSAGRHGTARVQTRWSVHGRPSGVKVTSSSPPANSSRTTSSRPEQAGDNRRSRTRPLFEHLQPPCPAPSGSGSEQHRGGAVRSEASTLGGG